MSLARRAQGALLVAIVSSPVALGACGDSGIERGSTGSLAAAASQADSIDPPAPPPPWTPRPITAPRDSGSAPPDTGRRPGRRPFALRSADSARWPVAGPPPAPDALLPHHRIVAYYGNPLSTRMGIMGQLPPDEMLARLEATATEWARADTARPVLPALHLIATVAQGKPGKGGTYRLRMEDTLIERVASWAEARGWVLFLDVQIGHSTVAAELPRLAQFLQRPYVHLALDPEFAMKLGGVPGRRIGTLDAADVNYAIGFLRDLVEQHRLPPKVLVVHRFTQRMLTNHHLIRLDPRVQVVIDMDGFGTPRLKQDGYRFFIVPEPVQYTGFKLFYKNDRPMMAPDEVLELYPVPLYIQYQ